MAPRKEQKRHLSEQQKKRIRASQIGVSEKSALVVAQRRTSVKLLIEGVIHTAVRRANLSDIVVGDSVAYETTEGRLRITARHDRRNAFCGLVRETTKTFAANIDALVFVCAPLPHFDIVLLEQALLAACSAGIHSIIVCNKRDVFDAEMHRDLTAMLQLHQDYGRTVVHTSATEGDYEELSAHLRQGRYLLFGQSGVGKSALLNCLFPEAKSTTQAISSHTQLGQHTTSVARLYHADGLQVIDCPGVRMLVAPYAELSQACFYSIYPDIGQVAQQCRFRNCAHNNDQGCKVQVLHETNPSTQSARFLVLNHMLQQEPTYQGAR